MRHFITFLWQYFPATILKYFGSIFQYDYLVYSSSNDISKQPTHACDGVVGVNIADPLEAFLKQCLKQIMYSLGLLIVVIYLVVQVQRV